MLKEEFSKILETLEFDFTKISFEGNRPAALRENIKIFEDFKCRYPDLCKTTAEFLYFSQHYQDTDFIDSQFCICGKRTKFDRQSKKYALYCSPKCAYKDPNLQERREQTLMQRYGCKNPMQSEEVKNKTFKTNIERYGSKCPCTQGEALEKAKKTRLERYGAEQVSHSEILKFKILQTNISKYGNACPLQNQTIRDKAISTLQKNFGVDSPMKSITLKKKTQKTNLEKYGVKYISQNREIALKMSANIKKHFKEAYNRESNMHIHRSDEWIEIMSFPEALKSFIEKENIKTTAELMQKLNLSRASVLDYLHKYDLYDILDHYTSSYEVELQELFPFMSKTRKPLYPYEVDLYSEEHKFGIEFNGNYWHSDKKLEISYHQKKSLLAEEKGIFLYHIWEHEWLNPVKREKILSQIKNILGQNERKVFARKCEIRKVSALESKVFLDSNHLQNSDIAPIRYGLYFENELVSLMTFCKPRFDKKYQWELSRFCNKKNTSVVGSASKLFKHFLKEYNPISVLSYSHIDKGRGNLYQKLGFILDHISNPGYSWIKDDQILSRYQCQKHKLISQGFQGNSEKEIMESRGFYRIFDCGNKVWTWNAV